MQRFSLSLLLALQKFRYYMDKITRHISLLNILFQNHNLICCKKKKKDSTVPTLMETLPSRFWSLAAGIYLLSDNFRIQPCVTCAGAISRRKNRGCIAEWVLMAAAMTVTNIHCGMRNLNVQEVVKDGWAEIARDVYTVDSFWFLIS